MLRLKQANFADAVQEYRVRLQIPFTTAGFPGGRRGPVSRARVCGRWGWRGGR